MGSAGKKTGASSRTDMHFRAKVRKKGEVRVCTRSFEEPHYEHAVGGVAENDRQQGSGQAYGEASGDRGGGRLKPVARIFPVLSPFLVTFRWMCRFGGGGCREEFRE